MNTYNNIEKFFLSCLEDKSIKEIEAIILYHSQNDINFKLLSYKKIVSVLKKYIGHQNNNFIANRIFEIKEIVSKCIKKLKKNISICKHDLVNIVFLIFMSNSPNYNQLKYFINKYYSDHYVDTKIKLKLNEIIIFSLLQILCILLILKDSSKSLQDKLRSKCLDICLFLNNNVEYLGLEIEKKEIQKQELSINALNRGNSADFNIMYNGYYTLILDNNLKNNIELIVGGESLYNGHRTVLNKSIFTKLLSQGLFLTTATLLRNISGEMRKIEFAVDSPFKLNVNLNIDNINYLCQYDDWLIFSSQKEYYAFKLFCNNYLFFENNSRIEFIINENRKKGEIYISLIKDKEKKLLLNKTKLVDEQLLVASLNYESIYNQFSINEKNILKKILNTSNTASTFKYFKELDHENTPIVTLDFVESGYQKFLEQLLVIKKITVFLKKLDIVVLLCEPYENKTIIRDELNKLLLKSQFYKCLNNDIRLFVYSDLPQNIVKALKKISALEKSKEIFA